MRSARQRAAAQRNIVKAQRASAAARRGKKRSATTGHTYGKGKAGRKATKRALYGSKRHGLSPTQHARRRQRANKWKRRAGVAVSTATTAALVYNNLTPGQKTKVKAKGRDFARTAKTSAKYRASGMHRQIKRHMKASR